MRRYGVLAIVACIVLFAIRPRMFEEHLRMLVVIDAGSSGSRAHIYSTRCAGPDKLVKIEEAAVPLKIEPGISTFADDPEEAARSLEPLLEFASAHIPEELHSRTQVVLLATAGLRMLSQKTSIDILAAVRKFLSLHSPFEIAHVDVMTGEQEAIWGWTAVNYASNLIGTSSTHAVLDMGGASAQVVMNAGATDMLSERRPSTGNLNGREVVFQSPSQSWVARYRLFLKSELGYGANEARRRYAAVLRQRHQNYDPCLCIGMREGDLIGTGNFSACYEAIASTLMRGKDAQDRQLPAWARQASFIGLSEFWYTTDDVLKDGGEFDGKRFSALASKFCATPWKDVQAAKAAGVYPKAKPHRLKYQCFKSGYMYAMLRDGYALADTSTLVTASNMNGLDLEWTLGAALSFADSAQCAGRRLGRDV